jgi:membrane protein DedA with SNARE-associated domain
MHVRDTSSPAAVATLLTLPAVLISGHEITHLIGRWGYAIVFAMVALQGSGVPVPGASALVAGAVYAATTHRLAIAGVIAAAASGAIVGQSLGYGLGRWGGWPLLRRYGHRVRLTESRLKIGRYLFAHHGGKVVFFGRFVSGLRTLTGFLAGANRMPLRRFILFNVAGGIVWAVYNGLKFFYFADILKNSSTAVSVAVGLVGAALTVALLLHLRRRGQTLALAAARAYPEPLD